MRYLIIGGGICGTSAAEELRKIDADAEITLVSHETHRLYSRVLLPRYIKGSLDRERCFLKKETWYEEQNISRLFGISVIEIDPLAKTVLTADGRNLSFDKLLIATSGNLLKFPDKLDGISYLRTIDDADELINLLKNIADLPEEKRRAGIVGGSFIAVEYINFFAQHKIPTDLFMLEKSFFGGVLDDESFAILRDKIESEGIRLYTNQSVKKLLGTNKLEGLQTEDKEFSLNLLGVGIGIRPDFSWLKRSGIEVNRGVLTNEFLETNIPNIYAAGDVAEFYDVLADRHVIVGNWLNAQAQGRIAAKTMSGERTNFLAVRAYSTNVCGNEIIFIGDTDINFSDKIFRRGSHEENGVTQVFTRNERVVGATLVNRNFERSELTKMIHEKALISAFSE